MTITRRNNPSQHRGFLLAAVGILLHLSAAAAIGVNYGTLGNNLPAPPQVVNFLKTQTIIDRVKIYDTNPDVLRAFANSGIAVTVTVANANIPQLTQPDQARQWVATNIAPFLPSTNIIRILVGNEILHGGDHNLVVNLLPAMKTLRNALVAAGFGSIQVSTSHALGIMAKSEPPSIARFQPGYNRILTAMLQFLRETKSSFAINPYPYFAYTAEKANYALFKPNRGVHDAATGMTYINMFEAMLDAIYSSMKALGYGDVPIMVAETGWPSAGDPGQVAPGVQNAAAYNSHVVQYVNSKRGTPLMPNRQIETYIFALFNENIKPGGLAEKNFGLFQPDFSPVYNAGVLVNQPPGTSPVQPGPVTSTPPTPAGNGGSDSSQQPGNSWCVAKDGASDQALQSNLDYACGNGADCKPIQASGSCFEPNTIRAHASYAMNSYYQINGRQVHNCDFGNTGLITNKDPSSGSCKYS